jgi:hypothetical protein
MLPAPPGPFLNREVGSEILPYLSVSPLPQTLSHDPVEPVAEVRLACKAVFRGDLGEGIIGHQQKALGTLDAPAYEVLVRCAAGSDRHHNRVLPVSMSRSVSWPTGPCSRFGGSSITRSWNQGVRREGHRPSDFWSTASA